MKRGVLSVIGRGLGMGLAAALVVPIAAAGGVLAVSHLAGFCGAGTSGGCEMGAAGIWLYALVPAFVLGAGLSVYRDSR